MWSRGLVSDRVNKFQRQQKIVVHSDITEWRPSLHGSGSTASFILRTAMLSIYTSLSSVLFLPCSKNRKDGWMD